MTGGNAFFPMTPKEFFPVYHEIAAALRHQYLLGIAPAHDGKFHPLSVQVLDNDGQPPPKEGKSFHLSGIRASRAIWRPGRDRST